MESIMTKIAIVYHSGFGHTKILAEAVADGAATVAGSSVHLIAVDEVEAKADILDAADAIIFGSPTYMGSASAKFKEFMEWSSKIWYVRGWADKLAAGFTASASQSGDKLNVLIQMAVFAAQHGMVWVGANLLPGNNTSKGSPEDLNRLGSYLGAMAQNNADQGPEGVTTADHQTARHLGQRVAEAAVRWSAGK
ncbi:Multimeric flavodoxin WrbA [Candidatus Terasakiella magnetica]|nr:Multimeric flavodoxin WrbA [Candidatus Terasakiella magnetica]